PTSKVVLFNPSPSRRNCIGPHRTWNLEPGTWNLELGTWNLDLLRRIPRVVRGAGRFAVAGRQRGRAGRIRPGPRGAAEVRQMRGGAFPCRGVPLPPAMPAPRLRQAM